MSPFYNRLPGIGGYGIERDIDRLGAGLAGLTVAGIAAHATLTAMGKTRRRNPDIQSPPDGSKPSRREEV